MANRINPEIFREQVTRHRDALSELVNLDGNMSVCPEALEAVVAARLHLMAALEALGVQQARY